MIENCEDLKQVHEILKSKDVACKGLICLEANYTAKIYYLRTLNFDNVELEKAVTAYYGDREVKAITDESILGNGTDIIFFNPSETEDENQKTIRTVLNNNGIFWAYSFRLGGKDGNIDIGLIPLLLICPENQFDDTEAFREDFMKKVEAERKSVEDNLEKVKIKLLEIEIPKRSEIFGIIPRYMKPDDRENFCRWLKSTIEIDKHSLWLGNILWYFVDHEYNHSFNLWTLANEIFKETESVFNQYTNKSIITAFSLAIWLHDIGLKGHPSENLADKPEYVREYHGLFSALWLLKYKNLFFLNNFNSFILKQCALLCAYHQNKAPIDTGKELDWGWINYGKALGKIINKKGKGLSFEDLVTNLKTDQDTKNAIGVFLAFLRILDTFDFKTNRVGLQQLKKYIIKRRAKEEVTQFKKAVSEIDKKIKNSRGQWSLLLSKNAQYLQEYSPLDKTEEMENLFVKLSDLSKTSDDEILQSIKNNTRSLEKYINSLVGQTRKWLSQMERFLNKHSKTHVEDMSEIEPSIYKEIVLKIRFISLLLAQDSFHEIHKRITTVRVKSADGNNVTLDYFSPNRIDNLTLKKIEKDWLKEKEIYNKYFKDKIVFYLSVNQNKLTQRIL